MRRLPQQSLALSRGAVAFAHRGGSLLWPENTMLALRQGLALGVDALEIDVHRTRDDEIVVIHDATVDRTTDGQGAVSEFLLSELQQLDAGYWWSEDNGRSYPFRGQGLYVPTLREVFEAFPHTWINIDIKQHDRATVAAFVAVIEACGMGDKVLVGSFDTATVNQFRRLLPQAATAATYAEVIRLFLLHRLGLGRFARLSATAIQVSEWYGRYHIMTPRFVKAAHEGGTAVHVWTVDDEAAMQRLLAMGVDGIMSDRPDRLMRVLARR